MIISIVRDLGGHHLQLNVEVRWKSHQGRKTLSGGGENLKLPGAQRTEK